MDQNYQDRYDILRQLAVAGTAGADLQNTAAAALKQAVNLVGLKAAAVYLWDKSMAVNLSVAHAESEVYGKRLSSLEEDLFAVLRRERQLVAAYMSFGGETPMQSFTLPLKHGKDVFGAVIGIGEGSDRLVAEDLFLEALSASLSLNVLAREISREKSLSRDLLDKERLNAVLETAVTVNHEINNPLTAILGNVQLLLMSRKDLDDDLVTKLKTIEASAMRIKDVTQRLLRLTSARSVDYTEGTSMLDLSDESE
jgi:signal transduction histidine kinase